MARGVSALLSSYAPSTVAPAKVLIGHVQLRDVLICPHERGLVCYPNDRMIMEHDILASGSEPRLIADLSFLPNSLSALVLPDTNDTLLAAGGQDAELYLSLYSPSSPSSSIDNERSFREPSRRFGRQIWGKEYKLEFASVNNSVLLTSLALGSSHESSVEPRVVISNNDRSIKFIDVAVRTKTPSVSSHRLSVAGELKLDVPMNHSSISPDGRTLLSVGDSPDVYLHRIAGGSKVTFTEMARLSLSPYITTTPPYVINPLYTQSQVPASFSTAFSANGSKFAVASQEGVVVVWDVRSTKPLKVIQTDKTRPSGPTSGNGGASGWLYDPPWDWSRGSGNAPGWGVRSVKFSPPGAGREVMTFTEHTSLMHVIDARTFETEEIVRMPNADATQSFRPPTARPRSASPHMHGTTPPSEPTTSLPPPPSRILLFSGAVEDTFRIPISEPSNRRRRHVRRIRNIGDEGNGEEDPEGIVIVPPLGDREVEDDVRRLLGRHRSRDADDTNNRDQDGEENEDDMDVDELEADCLSSHTPSRSSSPAPPPSGTQYAPTSAIRGSYDSSRSIRPTLLSRRESSGPYVPRRPAGQSSRRHRRGTQVEVAPPEVEVDYDLAGTCFDPSGEFIYVASTKGVAEWKVKGAERRWWIDSIVA